MTKLTLQVDALKVESFETLDAAGERRGTVVAHMSRPGCFGTEWMTGSCCDITFAPSCVQTNCCNPLTGDPCFA